MDGGPSILPIYLTGQGLVVNWGSRLRSDWNVVMGQVLTSYSLSNLPPKPTLNLLMVCFLGLHSKPIYMFFRYHQFQSSMRKAKLEVCAFSLEGGGS